MIACPLRLKDGAIILEVGVSAFESYVRASNPPRTFLAIFDTGANISSISPHVAGSIRPPNFGRTPVIQAGGRLSFEETYGVRFKLGGHETGGRWIGSLATSIVPATPDVDIIIGMDLLAGLDWAWQGGSGVGTISLEEIL